MTRMTVREFCEVAAPDVEINIIDMACNPLGTYEVWNIPYKYEYCEIWRVDIDGGTRFELMIEDLAV